MKKRSITALILGLSFLAIGQKSPKELKADKQFDKLNYSRAITKYNAIDELSTDGKRNLAESYRLTFETAKAEEVYADLVQSEDAKPVDYYYYAYTLKENSKYLESNKWMDKFQTTASTGDLRVRNFVNGQDKLSALLVDNGSFTVKSLEINSAQQDFGTALYGDKIVFASSREGAKAIRRSWSGNNLPFLDMYQADVKDDMELTSLDRFGRITNKKYHEGPASFAQGGNAMAFTRNSYSGKSSDGTIKFKVFFSEKNEKGKWSDPEGFHLNSEEYSVGHPFLTEDGKTMYFASDMPGGYGLADLYKVTKDDAGVWGEPTNLGNQVNTEGNDVFPFVQEKENLLLFASDGHMGLGGLDIYVAPMIGNSINKIENLGTPINSSKDDFAFLLNESMTGGYFSSNREGGKGDDDIYSFNMLKPFVFGKRLEGVAKDTQGNLLSDVTINLYENGQVVNTALTDAEGKFAFTVDADKDFTLDGNRDKYYPGQNKVSSKTNQEVIQTDVTLEKDPGNSLYLLVRDAKDKTPLEGVKFIVTDNMTGNEFVSSVTGLTGDIQKGLTGKKLNDRISYNIFMVKEGYFPKTATFNHQIIKEGRIDVHQYLKDGLFLDKEVADLSDLVEISPINFDLNKYNIRPDAAQELEKIVSVMNKYPDMVVELGSHTDCRASKAYNEKLSDRRAKASAEYIKSRIPNADNIYGKGYGESKILNGCTCEGSQKVPCTEEQHSSNRRTEFKVVNIGNSNVEVKNTSTDSFD